MYASYLEHYVIPLEKHYIQYYMYSMLQHNICKLQHYAIPIEKDNILYMLQHYICQLELEHHSVPLDKDKILYNMQQHNTVYCM